jgi:hypothetical protein
VQGLEIMSSKELSGSIILLNLFSLILWAKNKIENVLGIKIYDFFSKEENQNTLIYRNEQNILS